MSHSQEPEWLKYQSHGVWVVCWCHVKIITFPSYLLWSENRKLHDWLTICWNHFRLKDHSVDVWKRKPDEISLCLCLFFLFVFNFALSFEEMIRRWCFYSRKQNGTIKQSKKRRRYPSIFSSSHSFVKDEDFDSTLLHVSLTSGTATNLSAPFVLISSQ